MAAHFDLEEQEQIAEIKHFWNKYGNLITWLLILVLAAYAGWNGWQYWQRKTAYQAAALYDDLDRAVQNKDLDKVRRVWGDMQANVTRAIQTQQGGLLAAKAFEAGAQGAEARAALQFVVDKASDDGLVAVARLRLAALELDAKSYDAALKWLDAKFPVEFEGLAADRRGDAWLAQGKTDQARSAYQTAWDGLAASPDYRRMVEAKLNAVGVDPATAAKKE